MSPKFLCCLPLRLGACVISGLQGLVTLFIAVALWMAVALEHNGEVFGWNLDGYKVSSRLKILTGVLAVVETLVAVSCIFGFIGSIRKKYTMVAQFAGFLKSFLILAIIVGAVNIVFLWIDYKDRAGSCTSDDSSCSTLVFIVATVFIVLPILLQTYAVYIVSAYAHKLAHDEKLQLPRMLYSKITDIDAPKTSYEPYYYPYTGPSHSYGLAH
ncbi:hypothetical protein DL96DRAFT_1625992 [Flagelloscypha sp. PMI_526]|nr:hypothetical protein DL96DRAFT_1625992 [Flagelloscypha sp. PMI_526]